MKYEVVANLKTGKLTGFGKTINISCIVRNEVNGWRKKHEVIKSIPSNKPIQPRQFPKGEWNILRPVTREDPYLAPFFIPTDAFQFLPIWELDSNGHYSKPTDEMVKDKGYGLHTSTSNTTQGCIKILKLDDLLWFVTNIINALDNKNTVSLLVV